MKKLILPVLTAFVCLFLAAGCASVDVSTQGANTVVVQNSGCYLFCVIPLCSGDPDYPNQSVSNWFDNTVKLETNIRLLCEEAEKQGARDIRNIVSHKDDDIIIYLLLKRKIFRTSAELVK